MNGSVWKRRRSTVQDRSTLKFVLAFLNVSCLFEEYSRAWTNSHNVCLLSLSLSCVDFGTSLSSFFSCIVHPHFFILARSVCVLCRRRVRIANSMESSLVHPLHRPSRKALSHAAAAADGPSGTQYPLFTRAAHRPTTVHSKKEKKTPILLPLRPRQEDNSTASKNATQRDRKCTHP